MTDETADPVGPEPEPPVPGWPKESGERFDKAKALIALGQAVYPTRFERSHALGVIVQQCGDLVAEDLTAKAMDVRIAGRVLTRRTHGKTGFATLTDGDATLQIYVRLDGVGEKAFEVWKLVDMADFIRCAGHSRRACVRGF